MLVMKMLPSGKARMAGWVFGVVNSERESRIYEVPLLVPLGLSNPLSRISGLSPAGASIRFWNHYGFADLTPYWEWWDK
jgi:hypothetical protein